MHTRDRRVPDRSACRTITDGEFRRRSWSAGFIDAVEGFGLRDGTLTFRNETSVVGVAASPYAKAPLRRTRRIVADDYWFLKSVVRKGVPKVTIAAPDVMHYFLGRSRSSLQYTETAKRIFRPGEDLSRRDRRAGGGGLRLPAARRYGVAVQCATCARALGTAWGADELTERYARLINEAAAARPAGMTLGIHPLPRQSEGLDGRGRLRADRRSSFQPHRCERLLPRVR